jgi:hypothetical protein
VTGEEKKIFLHVGLHKTGTTFLQNHVFTKLDPQEVCYNPTPVKAIIKDLYRKNLQEDYWETHIEAIEKELKQIPQPIIFISYEILSGTPWNNYEDFTLMADFLAKAFPNPVILLVIRNQVDWLISLYKEALKDGAGISINKFLNFQGTFKERASKGYTNVNALGFNFVFMSRYYEKVFGSENVHLLFYEDLSLQPEYFFSQIEKILKCHFIQRIEMARSNQGFSTSSILLLTWIRKVPWFAPQKTPSIVHPIFFLESILSKYDDLSLPIAEAIKRAILTRKVPIFLYRLIFFLKLDYKSSKRRKMKFQNKLINAIEKKAHFNWELMGNAQQTTIKQHYYEQNTALLSDIDEEPVRKKYFL